MLATQCGAHEARQQEGKARMAEQVFVKVLGFDDTERHALNTLFRLSESGPVHYLLWAPDAPAAAKLALVDGESYEAQLSLGLQQDDALQLVWVGDNPPAGAARTFARPLHWPHVVQAMDSLFGILPDMDLDLGMDLGLDVVVQVDREAWPDTAPPADAVPPPKRVLVINPSLEERLYLRARLSLDNLQDVDEAVTGADLADLLRPLVDGNAKAATLQRQCCSKATDPGADDCNFLYIHDMFSITFLTQRFSPVFLVNCFEFPAGISERNPDW